MRLSYSKLTSFETCLRMFYLEHVKHLVSEDSFYTQYGKFIHELIDLANKGESVGDELLHRFKTGYDKFVTIPHPLGKEREEEYFLQAYDYIAGFKSVISGAEIIASEQKYITEKFGGEYSGIIDMIVRLPDGSTAIVDHKSTASKSFRGKSGDRKFRQLYLYSTFPEVRDNYSPDKLIINCFRENKIITRDFDKNALAEALDWAECTAHEIRFMLTKYADTESAWETNKQYFWCENVCGCSDYCEEMM